MSVHSTLPLDHPGLRPDSRLTAAVAAAYADSGQWTEETLSDQLTRAATATPEVVAAVEYAGAGLTRRQLTYRELDALVNRYAAGLLDLGVGTGDSVVVMLPNSIDFAALIFAINRIGAVYTGIPVAYGSYEVGHILRTTSAKVVVCQAQYASSRPLDTVRQSLADDARPVVLVRGATAPLDTGEKALDELGSGYVEGSVRFPEVDPRSVCHVGFTSGTTGPPKGVLNTNQTLLAVLRNWIEYFGRENVGDRDSGHVVNAIISPVGHHSGFLWGVVQTARLGGTAVHLDKWSPARGAQVLRAEGATIFYGAPTFLQDLLTTDLVGDPQCRLRAAIVTGSPVPRTLPAAGREAFGCWIGSAWGMTEIGIGISCRPQMSDHELASDGRAFPGVQARIVDEHDRELPAGEVGRLQVRSAGVFLGYLGLPDKTAKEIDSGGWFDTGDNARIDGDGLVYLEGRTKDIIIRGGENIPVVAVESVLYSHPDILDVAVIGLPDPRLGERACAVTVLRDGAEVTLDELNQLLIDRGISKHFLPERLVTMPELPKTPSGKIRKVELRAELGDPPGQP